TEATSSALPKVSRSFADEHRRRRLRQRRVGRVRPCVLREHGRGSRRPALDVTPPHQSSSPSSSHSRQTHSPSWSPSALNAAGTLVPPQRGQIGGRSSSSAFIVLQRATEWRAANIGLSSLGDHARESPWAR